MVDLLIAMANAAATSPRAEVIFDPFPSIVNPEKPDELVLDPKVRDRGMLVSMGCVNCGVCVCVCARSCVCMHSFACTCTCVYVCQRKFSFSFLNRIRTSTLFVKS